MIPTSTGKNAMIKLNKYPASNINENTRNAIIPTTIRNILKKVLSAICGLLNMFNPLKTTNCCI